MTNYYSTSSSLGEISSSCGKLISEEKGIDTMEWETIYIHHTLEICILGIGLTCFPSSSSFFLLFACCFSCPFQIDSPHIQSKTAFTLLTRSGNESVSAGAIDAFKWKRECPFQCCCQRLLIEDFQKECILVVCCFSMTLFVLFSFQGLRLPAGVHVSRTEE